MNTVPLAELCTVQIGRTPRRSEARYWGGDLTWVTISDLGDSRVITETKEGMTRAGAEESNSKLLPPGTLLLSFKLSLGKRGIAGKELYTNEAIAGLLDLDESRVGRDYLYWALGAVDYESMVDRAAMGKTLNKGKVQRIPIPLPPLPEQKRIAAMLDAADALRAKRRESLDQLDELVQSVFLEMFGDPVTNPKGWPELELGDALDHLTSGSRGWAKYYADEGDLFIRIQNVVNGSLVLDDVAYVDAPDGAEARRTKVEPGDVLLSITADLGRTAVVPDGITKAHINQHLVIIRSERLRPVFLSRYLESPGGAVQFNRLNRNGVKAGLNFADIRGLRVIEPPLERQLDFERAMSEISDQRGRVEAHLAELDTLFASLQSRAFKREL